MPQRKLPATCPDCGDTRLMFPYWIKKSGTLCRSCSQLRSWDRRKRRC